MQYINSSQSANPTSQQTKIRTITKNKKNKKNTSKKKKHIFIGSMTLLGTFCPCSYYCLCSYFSSTTLILLPAHSEARYSVSGRDGLTSFFIVLQRPCAFEKTFKRPFKVVLDIALALCSLRSQRTEPSAAMDASDDLFVILQDDALDDVLESLEPRAPGGLDIAQCGAPDLDLGALEIAAAPIAHARRSPGHMGKMRDALAHKRFTENKRKAKELKESSAHKVRAIALLSPSAAKAAGVSVRHVYKAGGTVSEEVALSLIRVALCSSARLCSERMHGFAGQVQATLMAICQDRQAQVVPMLAAISDHLRAFGYKVILGFSWEQDGAKMTLKSLGMQLASQVSKEIKRSEMTKLAKRHGARRFQHGLADNVVQMSGNCILEAVRGDEQHERDFHWHQAPMTTPRNSLHCVACALRRMPIRVDDASDLQLLGEHVDILFGSGCQDKHSSNIAFSNHVHAVVESLPAHIMHEAEWCELHNNNNLKATSKDLVRLTGRYYSLAALMGTTTYSSACFLRLINAVEVRLERRVGILPDPAIIQRNRRTVDMLFDLEAPHHYRTRKDGSKSDSTLLTDLKILMALDGSNWESEVIVCNCWDPDTGKPRHKNIDECRDEFVMVYFRLFLGSAWPLPSVTKFTNTAVIDRRVRLAMALHGIFKVLVEPFEFKITEEINIFNVGSGFSDFQLVHRGRKHQVWKWSEEPHMRWDSSVLGVLTTELDSMMYKWFGAGSEPGFMHDVVKDDGIVGAALEAFARLLEEWHNNDAACWQAVDAIVAPCKRSEAPEAATRCVRRNIHKYAAGMFVRYEKQIACVEKPFHVVHCRKCSPSDVQRQACWAEVSDLRDCCKTAACRKIVAVNTREKREGIELGRCSLGFLEGPEAF
jgi:hypothetical protein